MSREVERDRLTELDEATCLQLLTSHHIGRIAFNAEPGPEVFPVNYAVRDRVIVFRTAAGAKWDAATRGSAATLEVDGVDPDRRSAWSVVVRGSLAVADGLDTDEIRPQPLPDGDRPYQVRMTINEISGRRIPPLPGLRSSALGHVWTGQDGTDLLG